MICQRSGFCKKKPLRKLNETDQQVLEQERFTFYRGSTRHADIANLI